ncbi:MAG TPA: hypothetical protein VIU61_26195 [Kofleriaceae bacterium]
MRDQLAVLEAAGSVDLGPFGGAAYVSDACRAYQALAADRHTVTGLEAELVRMTREGTPPAILYAALLLRGIGRDPVPLLAAYGDDRREVCVNPGGCGMFRFWMCEAVRWVETGQFWTHPEKRLAQAIEVLERPGWFELPSNKVLAMARHSGRCDGHKVHGHWVHYFVDLLLAPDNIRAARSRLDAILAGDHPIAQLYAAVLVREIDRAAGERALETIGKRGGFVERRSPTLFRKYRNVSVRVADVVSELARWPADGDA